MEWTLVLPNAPFPTREAVRTIYRHLDYQLITCTVVE